MPMSLVPMAVTQWALPGAQHILLYEPYGNAVRWPRGPLGLRRLCTCPGPHRVSVLLARKLAEPEWRDPGFRPPRLGGRSGTVCLPVFLCSDGWTQAGLEQAGC